MLGRVRGMARGFKLADVGLPLRGVCPNGADGFKVGGVDGVGKINSRTLRCDLLLSLLTE